MARRSVLMFAYYFPPCVCWPTASMRAEGLAKGLAGCGWDPVVVTRGNACACMEREPDGDGQGSVSSEALEIRRVMVHPSMLWRIRSVADRLAASTLMRPVGVVLRSLASRARRLTERRNDWTRRAVDEATLVMRERHIDAVWTTSVPYRSIAIGRNLQRRYGAPWVADLRDSIARDRQWTGHIQKIAGLRMRRRWFRALREASSVTCVSPQEAGIDSAALGREVRPLPSGFDRAAWASIRVGSEVGRWRGSRFVIVYAGAFFGNRTGPGDLFFAGLRGFLDASPDALVAVKYFGHHGTTFVSQAAERGCGHVVADGGMVSAREARVEMMRSDLLLILPPETREGGMPGGKLYEYLAAGTPIVAVPGSDQFVMQILREANAGEGASTPDAVADVLARHYEGWRSGRGTRRSLDDLAEFSWSARGRALAEIFDGAAAVQTMRKKTTSAAEPSLREGAT